MKLFESFTLKNMTLKNRLVMPPMCMYSAEPGTGLVNDFHLAHYTARAIGGAGLVIVEATGVTPEGRITDQCLGLWDDVMVMDLKHFDGSLRPIDRVPNEIKALYATAFEVEPQWLVQAAARRQKWIDQAQSLNIYMAGASGKKLDETYKLAWISGLKTTYYLRTMGATHAEKSTIKAGRLNAVSTQGEHQDSASALDAAAASAKAQMASSPATDIKFCAIDDPGCEACQ